MKDLAMTLQGNQFLKENKRWRFTQSRLEYITRKVRHTISIFHGEWFMDKTLGIPYIPRDEDGKVMHRRLIETALQTRITSVAGVTKLISFTSTLDKATRTLTVNFTVQIDTGETFNDSVTIGG
jgi:hypothetical protein